MYKITKVIIFGSYLSNKQRINDIDLAVRILPKYDNDEQLIRNEERRDETENNGRYFSNYIDRLFFPENEVLKYLKNRSRAISLHKDSDGILEKIEQKVIFDYHQSSASFN